MAGPPPPQESWGLDPLFFANVKVTAGEVVGEHPALVPAKGTNRGVHFFHGRPTKRYELMGHVVTLIVRDNKTIFTRTWRAPPPRLLIRVPHRERAPRALLVTRASRHSDGSD